MKIKSSILSLLLFFTLVPVAIFGTFSIYETNQKIEDMADRNLKAVSTNQIMNILDFCDDRKSEMEMVANYTMTQNAILSSLGEMNSVVDRGYMDNLLREQKRFGTFVASISIMDKNFHVVASSETYEISEISKLKYIDERFHDGNFSIGNAYERETDDGLKKVVPAYIGVFQGEQLIGYIAEELDTSYFDELRLNMDSLAEGTFYLLDGNGTIITAGDTKQKESIHHFVTSSSQRNEFQEKWNAIDHDANPVGEIYYRYQGNDYITFYSNVENTDWGIRVTENLSAQKETAKSYRVLIILTVGFLAAGILVAQSFITKKLLSPIEKIMQTFADIKQTQDYSLRIPVSTKDEMGQLGNGINELLSYIEAEDIQEKARQRHLKELAECDPLTGIKNKKAIEQKILSMTQQAAENGEQITVGFLDIDDFRNYNTNYGHQMGDAVIQFVAKILQRDLRGQVGRNGRDEFVFCYIGAMEKEDIENVAKTMLEQLNTEYTNEKTKEQMPVPCSIGIVTVKENTLDFVEIIKQADMAMYRAKEAGKNTYYIMEL